MSTRLLVRLALEHVEQLERSIAELDAAVDRVIAPFAQAVTASTQHRVASGPPRRSLPRAAPT